MADHNQSEKAPFVSDIDPALIEKHRPDHNAVLAFAALQKAGFDWLLQQLEAGTINADDEVRQVLQKHLFNMSGLNDAIQYFLAEMVSASGKGIVDAIQETSSTKARKAANSRIKRQGFEERHQKLKEAWLSGKYHSKNRCAEEECDHLGFATVKTARKVLEGMPDPDPWPAKGKK